MGKKLVSVTFHFELENAPNNERALMLKNVYDYMRDQQPLQFTDSLIEHLLVGYSHITFQAVRETPSGFEDYKSEFHFHLHDGPPK